MSVADRDRPWRRFSTDLATVLSGDLARFTSGLAGRADPRDSVGADDLLNRDMLAAIIARFETRFGATDPRAILSMWASIYFAAALPPLLAANIVLGVEPDTDLGQVGFIIAENLRIEALKVGEAVIPCDQAYAARRFDRLIITHLAPLIDLVATRGRVSRRLLWSNAGNVFEAFIRKLQSVTPAHAGFDHAHDLLASPLLANGDRNPLFQPVRYLDGQRIRRICCLRFLIPCQKLCGSCPLPVENPARAMAAEQQN